MGFLAIPFGYVLQACYWLTTWFGKLDGNYVIAMLLFALAMQLLLCPFGIIQQKNMVKQAKLRPMEYIIRKKYAGRNDRATMQKMNNEIMELQQREGYNPMKGCLPMLLQLIIILPIYTAVVNPLRYISHLSSDACDVITKCFSHYYKVDGDKMPGSGSQIWLTQRLPNMSYETVSQYVKEIPDDKVATETATKAALEELFQLNAQGEHEYAIEFANVPEVFASEPFAIFTTPFGWFTLLLLIPIVNLALTYLSQFVSRKLSYQDPYANQQQGGGMMGSMKIMMLAMPLMTFFFTFTFPAAIGVYWIFRTLLSMLQQFILSRIFKYPKYTEEDLKRIEKEMKEAKHNAAPKKRSLFQQLAAQQQLEEKGIRSLHHIDDDEE